MTVHPQVGDLVRVLDNIDGEPVTDPLSYLSDPALVVGADSGCTGEWFALVFPSSDKSPPSGPIYLPPAKIRVISRTCKKNDER